MMALVYGLLWVAAFITAACVEYYLGRRTLKGIGRELLGLSLRGAAIAFVVALLLAGIDGRIQCSITVMPASMENAK